MKIVLVTGANRGIGLEVLKQLARLGHKTILSGRDVGLVEEAQRVLANEGITTDAFPADVGNPQDIHNLVRYLDQHYDRLDVLVNNAGVFLDRGGVVTPPETVLETFTTNALGPYRLIVTLLPLLRRSHDARIINVSSGMGGLTEMSGGYPGYRISKAALNAVTRVFANDLAAEGFSVNSVCPGWVRTRMGGERAPRSPQQGAETIVWLATTANPPNGKFLRDRQEIPW
ncbi:MAG: SDR family oxidoreductase [Turneriella sp.]|nr:SDR family oxidoreductase [Leptospiraceae bacterium]MCX7633603.1 SDR family oxidoreductase [Turneriella sp.]